MGNKEPKLSTAENSELENKLSLELIPSKLGFHESPEMREVGEGLMNALSANVNPIAIKELASHYHALGEEIVSRSKGLDGPKVNLGFAIAAAIIRREAAKLLHDHERKKELLFDYKDQLKDALQYANALIYGAKLPLETERETIDLEIDRIYAEVGPRPEN